MMITIPSIATILLELQYGKLVIFHVKTQSFGADIAFPENFWMFCGYPASQAVLGTPPETSCSRTAVLGPGLGSNPFNGLK